MADWLRVRLQFVEDDRERIHEGSIPSPTSKVKIVCFCQTQVNFSANSNFRLQSNVSAANASRFAFLMIVNPIED